jgi:type II restriction/modification system DNA methylase subunit YeeA
MFAEDAGLLPENLLRRLAEASRNDPQIFADGLVDLFGKMADKGGLFGAERIQWFNGGLFDGAQVIPLTSTEIGLVDGVSRLDWSQVEPAIFGTLFERGLDPTKRSQLGAHYTDSESIMRLIEPVLMTPLRRDLEATKNKCLALSSTGAKVTARTPTDKNPVAVFNAFLARLRAVRVLDPACGSGNFLYLALRALKDLEHEAILWASSALGISMSLPEVGPQAVLGIEINPYAAELARVVIWIGEIQWMLDHYGDAYHRDPILRSLDNIECRDAVLDVADPDNLCEPEWPEATVIVGNPPFLGAGQRMRAGLGDQYVDSLFRVYEGRVARTADLVCYWHEKARAMVAEGKAERVGLLATQGIRGRASRQTLERIKETGDIFLAWSDEPWVVEGAAVHVSFLGYDDGEEESRFLDGRQVSAINANLSGGEDLTHVVRLRENSETAFEGIKKGGPFEISVDLAVAMLDLPNPDGRSNRQVVRPWVNGADIAGRSRGMWIVDFGTDMSVEEAALYEAPFDYVQKHVEPARRASRTTISQWWLHERRREEMRAAIAHLERFIATPNVSKHRLFVWLPAATLPANSLVVFARDDDYFFGVVHSFVHECWSRALGGQMREVESGFRYTPTSIFETFPFPVCDGNRKAAVGEAARWLDEHRRGWLDPPGISDSELRKRTLTNLYNQRPGWLQQAHERLDRAVHEAYGWEYPLEVEEILARLTRMNLGLSDCDG